MTTTKKVLIVYYSLFGHTERVAKDLAVQLRADVQQIQDMQQRTGWLSIIKAGLDAWRKVPTIISDSEYDPADYELTVIGTPVWAWHMTPAIRTYLQQKSHRFNKVAFFVTSGNTDIIKIAPSMEDLAIHKAIALAGFNEPELKNELIYDKKITAFVSTVKTALARDNTVLSIAS